MSERWQRLEAIYHDALAQPPDERAAFVTGACAGDAALEQEVMALLANAASAASFLERPAGGAAPVTLVGRQLGAFAIEAQIGAGGMGEVYRAKDTRLGRTVAVKILPRDLAADPDRRQRFQREARAVAALNHPNICTVHDVGQDDGLDFLVMELVEGESLATRLAKGPLPLDQALSRAMEIADALDKAHRQGIIHRDLKPGNVMLTKHGAKVLDFGLARFVRGDTDALAVPAPTATDPLTEPGAVLGTLQYMAPEQIEGRPADARTDIFAFGAMLYEMLTGRRAFEGASSPALLAAILRSEPPPVATVQPLLPRALDRLVQTCLAKDPDDRFASLHDVRLELRWMAASDREPGTPDSVHGRPRPPARNVRLAWMAAFAITLVAAVLAIPTVRHLRETPPALAVATHLEMSVRPADQLVGSPASVRPSRTALAISPDGRLVVFSATRGTVTRLYLRGLDRAEATPVPGTDGARGPFFSPDGTWIGFWADNKLKKVPTAGGPVAAICDAPHGAPPGFSGASWGEDGTILFATGGPISKVPSAGGTPTTVASPDGSKGERFLLPQTLPGGKALLFTATTVTPNWETANVVLQSLDNGERRVLVAGGADARYVSTGHLVYMKTGTLMAVAFDPQSRQVTGAPVALIDGVMQGVNARNGVDETGAGQFAVSTSGTLLYVVGGIGLIGNRSVVWVDRTGAAQPLATVPTGPYGSPRLSPDGQKVALVVTGRTRRETDLWVYDVLSGAPIRLTFGGRNVWPVWYPDGKRLVYGSNATTTGLSNLHATNADGSGKPERLAPSDSNQIPSSWSPEANAIAFSSGGIWVLPMGGDRKPWLFLKVPSQFGLRYPEFSPDGRWMAYVSNESGANEVYVQPYPGGGEKIRISTAGGEEPIWANGRELLYRTSSGQGGGFFSVAIRSLSPFRKDTPRLLFEDKANEYGHASPIRGWDVSADGQRFLLTRREESTEEPVTVMHVVLNWTEELKRLVPTK